MHVTAIAIALGMLAAFAPQAPAQKQYAQGQEVRVCGEIKAHKVNVSTCETMLRVASAGEEFDVVIPASIRKGLSHAPERLRGGEACFTGRVTLPAGSVRVTVASAAGFELVRAPAGPAFGAEAAVPCGGPVTMPRVLQEQKPEYTRSAMRDGVEGTVEVEAVVGIDGGITDARIIRPLHPELDEQALAAVKEWKFAPGTMNGQPVPVLVDIELTFRIRR